jgi:hypothetical protein
MVCFGLASCEPDSNLELAARSNLKPFYGADDANDYREKKRNE